MKNIFGRKAPNFTSGQEVAAAAAVAPSPPPASAFQHAHESSHTNIEMTPPTTSYEETMEELGNVRIDNDGDDDDFDDENSFDDIEFGDVLVSEATAQVTRDNNERRKTSTFFFLGMLVVVGMVCGIVAAVVVNSNNGDSSTPPISAILTETEQNFDMLPPTDPPSMWLEDYNTTNATYIP